MKKFSKVLVVSGVACLMSVSAFAESAAQNPAEALANLSGRDVQSLIQERKDTGKTFGAIASEVGVLPEFQEMILQIKKERLDASVASGRISQEKADEAYNTMVANQANCDGTGSQHLGQELHLGLGSGNKTGGQSGMHKGGNGNSGKGQGGQGLRDGSCYE